MVKVQSKMYNIKKGERQTEKNKHLDLKFK